MTKICTKCGKELDVSCYGKHKTGKYGVRSVCKECTSKINKEYNSRLNIKKRNKQKRDKLENKDKKREYDRKHYSRKDVHERKNKQKIERKQKDINFKIACNLRVRISDALKGKFKAGSAIRDLGCSAGDLKIWLEQQFYPNPETGEVMSWENYGFCGWHIDHIIPLSVFDLSDRKQFLKACHWFNLQPLWAKENLSKSNKI